jgi:hypothetical protein
MLYCGCKTIKAKDFNIMIVLLITEKIKYFYTFLKQMPHWLKNAVRIQEQ